MPHRGGMRGLLQSRINAVPGIADSGIADSGIGDSDIADSDIADSAVGDSGIADFSSPEEIYLDSIPDLHTISP
ncbi:MAG: hypothetical protein ABI852_00885 [Gemmatimonadaceae bacterium]